MSAYDDYLSALRALTSVGDEVDAGLAEAERRREGRVHRAAAQRDEDRQRAGRLAESVRKQYAAAFATLAAAAHGALLPRAPASGNAVTGADLTALVQAQRTAVAELERAVGDHAREVRQAERDREARRHHQVVVALAAVLAGVLLLVFLVVIL